MISAIGSLRQWKLPCRSMSNVSRSGSDAGAARAYLRGRGYGVDVVDEFQLGYSPAGRSELVKTLTQDGFSKRDLTDVGLVNKGGGDWFRGRVMFPIRDLRGDAVGFGARVLDGDGPKYLNTPETRSVSEVDVALWPRQGQGQYHA